MHHLDQWINEHPQCLQLSSVLSDADAQTLRMRQEDDFVRLQLSSVLSDADASDMIRDLYDFRPFNSAASSRTLMRRRSNNGPTNT